MNKYWVSLVVSFIFFAACTDVETHTFIIKDLKISAEGPLFEGSNTAIGNYEVDLSDFFSQHNFEAKNIRSARLNSATLSMSDTLLFDFIEEITLQIAGDKTDMQKLGVLNPVPEGKNTVELQIAEDQKKVESFFKEPMFMFVVDFNVKQDTFIDLNLIGNFEFNLSFK
jgi:hypothetical protein